MQHRDSSLFGDESIKLHNFHNWKIRPGCADCVWSQWDLGIASTKVPPLPDNRMLPQTFKFMLPSVLSPCHYLAYNHYWIHVSALFLILDSSSHLAMTQILLAIQASHSSRAETWFLYLPATDNSRCYHSPDSEFCQFSKMQAHISRMQWNRNSHGTYFTHITKFAPQKEIIILIQTHLGQLEYSIKFNSIKISRVLICVWHFFSC